MMFGKKDLEDIVGMFSWFFGRGPKPQFDRYTYWEKFDYASLTIGTVIIGLTGFMMWFPLKTTEYLPGIFLNIALVIHSNEALLAMASSSSSCTSSAPTCGRSPSPSTRSSSPARCPSSTTVKSDRWSTPVASARTRSTTSSSSGPSRGRRCSRRHLVDHHRRHGVRRLLMTAFIIWSVLD